MGLLACKQCTAAFRDPRSRSGPIVCACQIRLALSDPTPSSCDVPILSKKSLVLRIALCWAADRGRKISQDLPLADYKFWLKLHVQSTPCFEPVLCSHGQDHCSGDPCCQSFQCTPYLNRISSHFVPNTPAHMARDELSTGISLFFAMSASGWAIPTIFVSKKSAKSSRHALHSSRLPSYDLGTVDFSGN